MLRGRFFSLLICSLGLSATYAQHQLNFHFRHITPADGLLHNEVPAITQDGKGFIWIGTINGLQRYDGHRFTYYPEMLSDEKARVTDGVEMYADKKNNEVWIRKWGVLEKFETVKNIFTTYDPLQLLKEKFFQFSSYKGFNKMSWIVSDNAVFKVDSVRKDTSGVIFNVWPSASNHFGYMVQDKCGFTWAANGNELLLFDPMKKEVYNTSHNPLKHPLLQFFITEKQFLRFIFIDNADNIWVTTWHEKFYKYNSNTKTVSVYSLADIQKKQRHKSLNTAVPLINYLMQDQHQNIWITTENAGLLSYNAARDNFDYCIAEENNSTGIKYNYKLFNLFTDKEQNIWIGTDKGISIFNPYSQWIKPIRYKENDPLSISKSEITSFATRQDGSIFIGTWGGGIGVYDCAYKFRKNILFSNKNSNYVWSMLHTDDNNMIIGCQAGTLEYLNLKTGQSRTLVPQELSGSTIRCMEKDKTGNIYFGLNNGKIVKWIQVNKTFVPYMGKNKIAYGAVVLKIFFDDQNNCWVSTQRGFKKFNTDSMAYSHTWLPDDKMAKNISGTTMQGIESLNDSVLMIGSVYGGLNFFNKNNYTFTSLTTADGLSSNNIHAIKKDVFGYVWFTTDFGLYKFLPNDKYFIPYTIEKGILNSSFSSLSFYSIVGGQWGTFSSNEAIHFNPAQLSLEDSLKPSIAITGFKLFGKNLFIDSLLESHKPLTLNYKENFFTIEFATLNFSSLHQPDYYYQLAGINNDWVNGGAKPFASFTNLPPGHYNFNVKAGNASRNTPVTSFAIIIEPPFWKTNWFLLLCILAATALIYILIKYRINTIRKEEKQKRLFHKQMAEMEMKALRSQMNPHFIFNCINSIDALIQSNDKYHATIYLNKFAKLIRNILDSSKQNTVTLAKDLDTLKLYIELEQLRHENKFTAEINADEALLQDDYKVPPLIIQPFVENAILHGIRYRPDNHGKLLVSVTEQKGNLHYIIEDNGVGRKHNHRPLEEKLSYGMQMSKDRVKLFNNEEKASVRITDLSENNLPTGTRVEVILKIT